MTIVFLEKYGAKAFTSFESHKSSGHGRSDMWVVMVGFEGRSPNGRLLRTETKLGERKERMKGRFAVHG